MSDCVLDANVVVAWIDRADSLHARAVALMEKLARAKVDPGIPDIVVNEAVSVLCRRFRERKRGGDLPAILAELRRRIDRSRIIWIAAEAEHLYDAVLDLVSSTGGRINFNDALIVLLQRSGRLGPVATFDTGFDDVQDFEKIDERQPE